MNGSEFVQQWLGEVAEVSTGLGDLGEVVSPQVAEDGEE
jgi:hypothetical protein